jgi:hypothetical protein
MPAVAICGPDRSCVAISPCSVILGANATVQTLPAHSRSRWLSSRYRALLRCPSPSASPGGRQTGSATAPCGPAAGEYLGPCWGGRPSPAGASSTPRPPAGRRSPRRAGWSARVPGRAPPYRQPTADQPSRCTRPAMRSSRWSCVMTTRVQRSCPSVSMICSTEASSRWLVGSSSSSKPGRR